MITDTSFRRMLFRIVSIDLLFWIAVPPLYWYTLRTPDLGRLLAFGLVACALRLCAWIVVARAELGPITRWETTAVRDRTDALVVEAVSRVRGAPWRLTLWFGVLWGAWMAATGTYAAFDGDGSLGSRWWMAAAMAAVTPILGGSALAYGVVASALRSATEALVSEADARGLRAPVSRSSVQSQIAFLAVAMAVCPIGWLGAMGMRAADETAGERAREQARTTVFAVAALGADAIEVPEGAIVVEALGSGEDAIPEDVAAWVRESASTAPEGARLEPMLDRATAYARAPDGRIVVAVVPVSAGPALFFVVAMLAFMGVISFWAPISAYSFGAHIGENIGFVMKAVGRVVDVGDLTEMKSVPVMAGDETGELARHFNDLLATMRTLTAGAARVAKGDLTVTLEAKGELPDAFRGMLEGLRILVGQLRETASQLASAAAEIYSASQEQEAAATQQASGITEVSRTIESLSTASGHVADAASNVLGDAEGTRSTTEQMAARIAELNGHAGRIGELLEVIRDVADRSDILALNGSLEAARAGDAGRGFALVATEMRRLAERVTATVEDVRKLLTDIRGSGSATVMATDQSRKFAESTTDTARRITLLTQQQRSAMEQVSTSAREIAGVIAQAASASTQQRVSAEDLKAQADRLETLVRRFEVAGA
jgi:methyl-accepting chemotaxis protein